MPAISSALPVVVPATVTSAARTPWLAPVAITSVTIGPGVTTRIIVISRKAANSSQFIGSHLKLLSMMRALPCQRHGRT